MRVLLTHHFPLTHSQSGPLVLHWAQSLESAGHEVRLLVVDEGHRFAEPVPVERVVCGSDPNADLTFGLPYFSTPPGDGRLVFASLTSTQIAQYRERLRRRLDAQILRFDPHVIHTQHVWLLGQLALESGVPYLMNAWGPELVDGAADERFGALAEQAAENAGRILATDSAAMTRVAELFPAVAERLTLLPDALRPGNQAAAAATGAEVAGALTDLYREVLDERFGSHP